jgi:hypothetical protein
MDLLNISEYQTLIQQKFDDTRLDKIEKAIEIINQALVDSVRTGESYFFTSFDDYEVRRTIINKVKQEGYVVRDCIDQCRPNKFLLRINFRAPRRFLFWEY